MRKNEYRESILANFSNAKIRRIHILSGIFIVILCVASGLYLHFAWMRNVQGQRANAMKLAESIGSLFQPEYIETIVRNPQDTAQAAYLFTKHSLTRLVANTDQVTQMFIVGAKNGKLVFVMDSNPISAAQTSSPGTLYPLEREQILQTLEHGVTTSTGKINNKYGNWITILTPIIASHTAEPIAVLGITYHAEPWVVYSVAGTEIDWIMVISILLLSIALQFSLHEYIKNQKISRKVAMDENLFHSVFDQAPIGISIGSDDKVTYSSSSPEGKYNVNHMFETILGRNKEELEVTSWYDITHPDDLQKDLEHLNRYSKKEIASYTIEKRFIRPDGSIVWTNMTIGPLSGTPDASPMHLCILEDITERKRIENALQESERSKAVLLSHLPGLAYRCLYDPNWTMTFVSEGCEQLTGYEPDCLIDNKLISFNDLIAPEFHELLWSEWQKVIAQHRNFRYEYEIIAKNKGRKWVLEIGQPIYNPDGSVQALEGIIIDISELKMREAQVDYLNEHDYLTGLHNRNYLEKQKILMESMASRPITVVICDINGVRLVNDAFSPAEGDHLITDIACLLQSFCREHDVISRTGGDEFTLLLPNTSEQETIALVDQMLRAVERYNLRDRNNPYEVSLSFGFHTTVDTSVSIEQATVNAEEHLNHRKLLNQKSSHNAILSSIMATLYARSQETEEHGKRLTRWTRMIGEEMNLDQRSLDDLMLLSMLHDIGKIGIDDRVLNKPDPLTPEEWALMKRHSEIGHKIVLSTPDLGHIAQYILCHHEKWDGHGYPIGLKGEEIPLPSRILSVADAYDAMTEDRVYRRALSQAEALDEIEQCKGTQFDPQIAEIFVRLVRSQTKQ